MPADENPFRRNNVFVGRQAEFASVVGHLASGQSTLLIGGRRAGKTTLASRLSNSEVRRQLIMLDAGPWTLDSEESVLNEIGLGIERIGELPKSGRPYTRESLTELLRQMGQVAIIIDEADRMLAQPWAGSFLSYLRWLDDRALRSTVAFLLIGGPSLAEYRNPDDHGSPPLNTADPIYLEPLSGADVREMITNMPSELTVAKVMREAGGHPWLINRLLADVFDGMKFQKAVDHVWDVSVRNFKVWQRQIGQQGADLLRKLPSQGLSMSEFRTGRMRQHREALLRCRYTCLVTRAKEGTYQPGPKLFLDWLSSAEGEKHTWDLAISYASEDQNLAKSIYDQLCNTCKVFFAPAESAYLWDRTSTRHCPIHTGLIVGSCSCCPASVMSRNIGRKSSSLQP